MISGKCPHCGGEVENGICPYCDSDLRDENDKNNEKLSGIGTDERFDREAAVKKQKRQKISAILICASVSVLVLLYMTNSVINFVSVRNRKNAAVSSQSHAVSDVISENSSLKEAISREFSEIAKDISPVIADKNELYSKKGRWSSGTYKVGEDIPFGTYLLMYDGPSVGYSDFPVGLYEDAQTSDDRKLSTDTWSRFSRYITVNDEGYLDVSWSILYDIQKNDVVNDPCDHCGMFLVGRDIEAGTYELAFDSHYDELDSHHSYGSYTIYSDVDIVSPVVKEQGQYKEGVTVTVSDGDFLKLDECVIKQ